MSQTSALTYTPWTTVTIKPDRYLAFRDRLRSSPEDRMAYQRLKRDLAVRER